MDYTDGLVSIVIPTHNREALIERAVRSAMQQTYPSIEILIVSDGSEDGTDDIVNALKDECDKIRYFSYHPGRGGNYARNMGIKNARGEWVAFLDDDDEWHPDKIEKQIKKASETGAGIICTAINSIDDESGKVTVFVPDAPADSSIEILKRNCIGSTTTVMSRHNLLDECGMFDEQLKAKQDFDLWIRLCQLSTVAVVETPCVEYHNLVSNDQISWNWEKYAIATEYMTQKYKELREKKLTRNELDALRISEALSISRKAMKAGNSQKVREYAKKALKIKFNTAALVYIIASFFSLRIVKKVRALLMK